MPFDAENIIAISPLSVEYFPPKWTKAITSALDRTDVISPFFVRVSSAGVEVITHTRVFTGMPSAVDMARRHQVSTLMRDLGVPEGKRSEAAQRVLALTAELKRPHLPDLAPELYADRANKKEGPIEFYRRVWGVYHDLGILFQDELERRNPGLVATIRAYCWRNAIDAAGVLPPPKRMRTNLLSERLTVEELRAAVALDNRRRASAARAKRARMKNTP